MIWQRLFVCVWATNIDFFSINQFFLCFLETNLFHTIVCVMCSHYLLLLLLCFYSFSTLLKTKKQAPVICTFSQSLNLLYGNQITVKK